MPEQSSTETDFKDVHALVVRADTVIDKSYHRVKPLQEYLYLPFYKGDTGFLEDKDIELVQQFEFAYCNTPKPKEERFPEEIYIGRDPYEEYRTLRHSPEFTACFLHRGEIDDEESVLTPPHDEKVLRNDLTWSVNMVENDLDQFVTFWEGDENIEDRYHDSKKRYHGWNCDAYFLCTERPCGTGCVHFRLGHSTVIQHMYMWRNHKAALDFFPLMGEAVTLNQLDFSKLMPYHKDAESAITCRECEVVWPTVWEELGGEGVNVYDPVCLQWTTPVGCRDVVSLFNGWVPDEEEYQRIIEEYIPPTLEKFDLACLPLLVLIDLIPFADEIDRYEETADEYSLFYWSEVSMCGQFNGYYERSNMLKWDDPEFKEKYPDLDPKKVPWLAYKFQWVPTAIRIPLKGKFRPAIRAAWYDFTFHSLRHSIGVRELDFRGNVMATGVGTSWTANYENTIQPCLDVCDMLLEAGMGWLPPVTIPEGETWWARTAAYGELYTERMVCARNGAVCETMVRCSPDEELCDRTVSDTDSMRKCGGCFCSEWVLKPEDCHVGTCDEEIQLPWYGGCDNTACESQTGGDVPTGTGVSEDDMPQAEDTKPDIDKHPVLFKTHAYTYNVLEGTVIAGEQHKINEELLLPDTSGFIQGGSCCTCLGPILPNYYLSVPMIEIGPIPPYYPEYYYEPEYYSCDPECCDPECCDPECCDPECCDPDPPEPDPCPCEKPYGVAAGWGDLATSLTEADLFAQVTDAEGNVISYGQGNIVLNQVPMGEVLKAVIGSGFGYPVQFNQIISAEDGKVYGIRGVDWIPCDAIVELLVAPTDGNPPRYLFAILTDCDESYEDPYYDPYYADVPECPDPECPDPECPPDDPYYNPYYADVPECPDPECPDPECPSDEPYEDYYYGVEYYSYYHCEGCGEDCPVEPPQPQTQRCTGVITIDSEASRLFSRPGLKAGLMDDSGNILCEQSFALSYATEYYVARDAAKAFNAIAQYGIVASSTSDGKVYIECDAYNGSAPTAYVRGENMAGRTIMWSVLTTVIQRNAPLRVAKMLASTPQALDKAPLQAGDGVSVHPAVPREDGYKYWSNPDEYIWPVDKLKFDMHEGWEVRDYCGSRQEPWDNPPVDMSAGGMLTTALVFDVDTDACKGEDADQAETRYQGWAAILWGEWLSNSIPQEGELAFQPEDLLVPPWKIGMAGDKTWDENGFFTGGGAELKCVDLTDPAWPGGTFHEAYRSRGGYVNVTPFYGPMADGEFVRGDTVTAYYEDIVAAMNKVSFRWPEPPYNNPPGHYRKYAGVLLELFTHGNVMSPDMLLPYYSDNPGVNWTSDADYIFNPYTATPEMTGCRALATLPSGKDKMVMTVLSRVKQDAPDHWITLHDQEREQFKKEEENEHEETDQS